MKSEIVIMNSMPPNKKLDNEKEYIIDIIIEKTQTITSL
jgi:hypothetical protein